MVRQRQQPQQVAHQVDAHVDRHPLAGLGLRHRVLARDALDLRLGGQPAGQRLARDAVAAQDRRGAHPAFAQRAQRVLGADRRLARGLGDAAALVEHHQHLGGELDARAVRGDEIEVRIRAGAGLRQHLGRDRQLVQAEAALDRQRRQQPVRRVVGVARKGHQQQRRRQVRFAERLHAGRRRVQRLGQFGRGDVRVECAHGLVARSWKLDT